MAVTNPQELLKHELGDLLYAEKQILKALRPMIRETSDPEMKARLEQHEGETEQQVSNLEQAFGAMGWKVKAEKCPGILGILEEKKEFKSEEEPSKPMLEAFNLGAGLRVEHYEIAAYRSAVALARSLGKADVAALLRANLEQEVAMAKFIEGASAKVLRTVQDAVAMAEAKTASKSAPKSTSKRPSKGASKRSARTAA
jgi:ferritin-like metal-binding protein YciE